MEFSKSQRGNTVLTYLGFEYNRFRENKATGAITWRCRQHKSSSCKAFINTNGDNIVGTPSSHSHDSCPQKAKADIAMSKMKESMKHVGATARNVIGNEIIGLNDDILAHLPKQSSITRNLLRHKKGGHHPNPNNSDFSEKYARSIFHDSVSNEPDRILAVEDTDLLQDKEVVYRDDTIDNVPEDKQVFNLLHIKNYQQNNIELSKNRRGSTVLTYLGFDYYGFRENKAGVITWRCRQRKSSSCKAFIKTNESNIVAALSSHSHNFCPQKSKANIAVNIKRSDAAAKNEMIGLNNDILAHFPKHSSITRNLPSHRKGGHPPNPSTPDFPIPEKYTHLILHDSGVDDPDRILAIGDIDLLQALDTDTIYGDGTFDEVPTIFFQLFTWYAKVGSSYPPCIYFLLLMKNMSTYNKMFQVLKDLLPSLAPQKVFIDFEKPCIGAVHLAFPRAEVRGCYFHMCQSLIRKISSVDLKSEFESEIEVKLMLKSLAALAFVPSGEVRPVFDILADTFPNEDRFDEILTYFFSTFIEGAARRNPLFPVGVWNHHEAAAERSPKTINCCQGFHNALNSFFHCSHPSIWILLDGLERDLAGHKHTLEKARMGQPEVKKKKYETVHEQLALVVQGYHQEQDKLRFLRRVANLQ